MKKLLIAMSAAAMFSLCAKAESTALLGGTNFESYEVGVPITTAQEGGLQFWTNASVGTTNETVNVGGESQIAVEGDGESANKYLKVDTTETLVRQTAELNASEIAPVSITNADVVVSAKVQFTAADEAPEAAEGDKLIVWAKAPDEDDPNSTTTNLMVTAKTANGVVTNFVTDVLVDAETWYDLEIKAMATGSQGEGNASAAFTVSIVQAGSGSTPVAVTVGGQEVTFKSLLDDNVTGAQTIASIGFKGTGAVDDIAFAKTAAVKPIPLAVEENENISSVTYKIDGVGNAIAYVEGATFPATAQTLVFTVTPASGYVVNSAYVVKPDVDEPVAVQVANNTLTLTVADYLTDDGIAVLFVPTSQGEQTYRVTANAVAGATVTFSTTDPVVANTTVTFTIAVTDETKEIDTVSDGTNTLTADNGTYSVTVVDADIVITVTLKTKTPTSNWPANWNNGAAATTAQAEAFTEWAKTNDATAANAQAAFLTGQDVANYEEVTFTSITIVNNKVVLTENVDLSKANGVVKIMYGATPTSLTNAAELGAELPATAATQFYKIVVDFQ